MFNTRIRKQQIRLLTAAYWLQVQQILLELQAAVLADDSIPEKRMALICTQLGDTDKCLVDGADEHLQLLNLLSTTQQVLHGRFD